MEGRSVGKTKTHNKEIADEARILRACCDQNAMILFIKKPEWAKIIERWRYSPHAWHRPRALDKKETARGSRQGVSWKQSKNSCVSKALSLVMHLRVGCSGGSVQTRQGKLRHRLDLGAPRRKLRVQQQHQRKKHRVQLAVELVLLLLLTKFFF